MISSVKVKETWEGAVNFPDHTVSHKWLDSLQGIELGPSDHNNYHLPGSIAIAPKDDFAFYRDDQVRVNGKYARVDLWGDACDIPLLEDTVDYVHSSHCFEHISNPILALLEANRVIRDGGYWMAIVPLPGAHKPDEGRPLATISEWQRAYLSKWTPETLPPDVLAAAGGPRGHVFVYSPETLKQLIKDARDWTDDFRWELVDEESPDSKVGNGFTLVYRVHKNPVTPKLTYEGELLREDDRSKRWYNISNEAGVTDKDTVVINKSPVPEREIVADYVVPMITLPEGGLGAEMQRVLDMMLSKARTEFLQRFNLPTATTIVMDSNPSVQEDTTKPLLEGVEEIRDFTPEMAQKLLELANRRSPAEADEAPKEEEVYYPKEGEFNDLNPDVRWIDKYGNM